MYYILTECKSGTHTHTILQPGSFLGSHSAAVEMKKLYRAEQLPAMPVNNGTKKEAAWLQPLSMFSWLFYYFEITSLAIWVTAPV